MRTVISVLALALCCEAQTNIYLRASGPQSQVVVGATNATPIVLTTQNAHGFSPSCNTTTNICYCAVVGVSTGTGVSPANGLRECVYQSSTTLALYDSSGSPIAGTGGWFFGYMPYPNPGQDGQWVAPLTKFTIPANAGPLGFLDGTNGDEMRRLATSTSNGLSSIVVSGGSGGSCASTGCTVTVNLAYNPTALRIPVAAGNQFSITGTYTGSGADLDTCGSGGAAQSPFTVASTTSSSYTSTGFTCPGLTTGTYTGVHMACGPAATPNDTIGGAQDCAVVSLMALNNSAWWTQMLSYMTSGNLTSSPNYKFVWDGGSVVANEDDMTRYGMAAVRFLVDRSNSLWLSEIIYALNSINRVGGVGFPVNSQAFVLQSDVEFNYTTAIEALALMYAVAAHAPEGGYWTSSEQTTFLNKFYGDVDDPTMTACTTTNQDAANTNTHNWVLSSGLVAPGTNDATHLQLPSSDAHYSSPTYYNGTVVQVDNNYGGGSDYSHYTYGAIAGSSGSSGVLTVTSWLNPQGGAGVTPALNQVVSATYNSGLTAVGTTGQVVCVLTSGNAIISFPMSGTNTISTASGAGVILAPGLQTSGAPTSASVYTGCSTVTSVSGTASITTTLGTKYTIFDTFTISSPSSGATATVTFTKSTPGSLLNPGDEVVAYNGWGTELDFPRYGSYVSSCSGSTCNVINSDTVSASTTTPQMAWRLPQWTSGDCGWQWAAKHQQNASIGVQSAVYGYGAGGQTSLANNNGTYSISDAGANGGNGGSPGAAFMAIDFAAAPDDPRPVRDLARVQPWAFDYACRPLLDFSTGRLRDGPGYSMDADQPSCELFEWLLYNSVPGYPTWYGTWAQNISLWKMYEILPQPFSGNTTFLAGWAGQSGTGYGGWGLFGNSAASYGWALDPVSFFAPSSNNAAWYRNIMENLPGPSLWGNTQPDRQAIAVLHNDPRISDSTYSDAPLQAAFIQSSSSQVTSLTGWPHLYRGDAFISRTCWQCTSGTLSIFDMATFTNGVYDSPRPGQISIWKNGCLLGADSNPCNSLWASDPSTLSDTLQLGGPGLSQFQSGTPPNIGITPETAWASANAGSYGSMFGDSQSRYAAACGNEAPNYVQTSFTLDHAARCWVHLKVNGHDEWIFQFDDVALAAGSPVSSISMNWHLQYPQNGQTQAPSTINYPTGSTTCTALSGSTCTSNTIKVVEDGNSGRTYGLMTWITSANTITVNDDCVGLGGGQCAPGSTYSGGNGYTHRFTVAGGTSVGANVPKMISVVGHKIMSSLTDTTFNTASLNPDGNWTGVQLTGAKSTGIALFAVGGSSHSSITSFTTSFSGTGDWLIMGLTPGTYSVTVAGVPVAGSPFTVGSGDGTIYFPSGAGTVVLNSGSALPPALPTSVQGQVSVTGNILIH